VGPTVFDINQASEFLLWVIAGGLGTLAGPMIASFGFQYLQTFLGTNQVLNTSLVFGAIIIFFVLLVPRGILSSLRDAANSLVSMVRVIKVRFRAEQLMERRT
jgi:ABC-type branched-subunit amino acid transport system permease subunit